jgi:hypothetical protein
MLDKANEAKDQRIEKAAKELEDVKAVFTSA